MSKAKGIPVSLHVMKHTLTGWYACATPEQRLAGMLWYCQANEFAQALSARFSLPVRQVAGIIAALSPETSWERNKIDATLLLASCTPGAPMAKVTTYGVNRDKAYAIATGANPEDVLGGDKVCAFFRLIADPLDDCVCVDRHAVRAATGKDLDTCRVWLQRTGVNAKIQQAYKAVAKDLSIRPHQLQAIVWLAYKES